MKLERIHVLDNGQPKYMKIKSEVTVWGELIIR